MASKSETQGEAEEHGKGGGKKKGLLLAVGAGVLVLALAGGGAWFFLSGKKEEGGAEAKAKAHPEHPPVYVTLEPFVVNLAGEEEHYLQAGINLKVADDKVPEQIKAHMPEIRNAVLLLLSSKHPEDLATLEGKNQLRREIRAAVNDPLGVRTPAPPAAAAAGGAVGEAHAGEPPAAPGKDAHGAAPAQNEHGAAPAQNEHAAAPAHDEHGAAGVLDVLLTSFVIQ